MRYHGDEGGAFEKSNRLAMDLAFASLGEANLRLRPLLVALTPGPDEFISTLASTSSNGLFATAEHLGNFEGWVGYGRAKKYG